MTNDSAPPLLSHLWKWTLVSGVLAVILGVLVLLLPGESIFIAAVLFGIYLLIMGIAQVIFAFSLGVSAGGRVLLFISGAAALILAVLAFRNINEAVLLLAIWIAVGFIFRGVATTVSAISDPDMPGRGFEIFFGIVTLIAGVIVLASPLTSLAVLTVVVGVILIVTGVSEIVSAFGIRKASKKIEEIRA